MTAVALTEASTPDAHAGLLFMDGGGYPRYVACGVVAAAAVCVSRRLILTADSDGPERLLVFETPVGLVRTRVRPAGGVTTVFVDAGPAFVHTAGSAVQRGTRRVPVDIAFGGDFFAIVDSEAAGVPLDRAHIADLRRVGAGAVPRDRQARRPDASAARRLAAAGRRGPDGPTVQ